MEPKYKVGDIVQVDVAVKAFFAVNAPRYIVKKVHDNRTPQLPNVEIDYDIVEKGNPSNSVKHIRESKIRQTTYCF